MRESSFKWGSEPVEVLLKDNSGGDAVGGKAALWRTESALKVLFSVFDNDIISYGTEYNEPLWKGDTAELFITLGRRNRYLELEVNPDGVGYAAAVENREGEFELEFLREAPFGWTAKRTETGYESEWTIPLEKLEALGFDSKNGYFNLYIQDYSAGELRLYALSPTKCGSFHRPEAFLKLEIGSEEK